MARLVQFPPFGDTFLPVVTARRDLTEAFPETNILNTEARSVDAKQMRSLLHLDLFEVFRHTFAGAEELVHSGDMHGSPITSPVNLWMSENTYMHREPNAETNPPFHPDK